MKKGFACLSVLFACFCFWLTPGYSAHILDQYNKADTPGGGAAMYNNAIAQTFTAGITGQLTKINLYFEYWGSQDSSVPITFEIRECNIQEWNMEYNDPIGLLLGRTSRYDNELTYGWNTISFQNDHINILEGHQYTIVALRYGLESAMDARYGLAYMDGIGPYGGDISKATLVLDSPYSDNAGNNFYDWYIRGEGFEKGAEGDWFPLNRTYQENADVGYISDTFNIGDWMFRTYVKVPEPATMVLLGLGLIGLAGIRRKINK